MDVLQKVVCTASSPLHSAGAQPTAFLTAISRFDTALEAASAVPFSLADKAFLHIHLQTGVSRIGFDYDVRVIEDGNSSVSDVIQLTSKNFGYDFALLQIDNGRGMFGLRKKTIRIYAALCNAKEYAFIGDARSLAQALGRIDGMYRKAAAAHLA